MVSYGGPQPLGKYESEVTAALGTGIAFSDKPRISELGWYGRYRIGLTPKFDIGAEGLGFLYSNNWTITGKLSARYTVVRWFRIDLGAGMGDNSYGRSVNGDVGLTFGSDRQDWTWNPYGTLRYGFGYGIKGTELRPTINELNLGSPANAHTVMVNIGAQAKLNRFVRMTFEGGIGRVIPIGFPGATIPYLSAGFSFRIPGPKYKVPGKFRVPVESE